MNSDWTKAAITTYSPDAILSGIVPALNRFIGRETGLEHAGAFLSIHDEDSIDRFYALNWAEGAQHAALVRGLFVARPVVVTHWRGPDALSRLQESKGNTQPALARAGSIRSLFWCDNPVCNLIHVSDDVDEMEGDYRILLDRKIADVGRCNAPLYANRMPITMVRHNALLEFQRVLTRNHLSSSSTRYRSALPHDGGAIETALTLIQDLMKVALSGPSTAKVLIRHFLFARDDFRAVAAKYLGARSSWEDLVITCGIESNNLWLEQLRHDRAGERTFEYFMDTADA